MLGLTISEDEMKELQYLVKREMEEILFDLEDPRLNNVIKDKLKLRYQVLFELFSRIGMTEDVMRYLPRYNKHHSETTEK